MRYVFVTFVTFLLLFPITNVVENYHNPMLTDYISSYKITMFREILDIIERDKIIASLIGEKGGSCKAFTNKYASILNLTVNKRQFIRGINHYFLILSETTEKMLILDSNWNYSPLRGGDNIIRKHWINKDLTK